MWFRFQMGSNGPLANRNRRRASAGKATTAEFQSRSCPVCGSTDDSRVVADKTLDDSTWKDLSFSSRKLPEYLVHRMVECPDCDVVYASPAPYEEVLEQAYRAAPFVSAEESAFAAETYRRLLRPLLARLSDRSSALDVGASDGTFLQVLQPLIIACDVRDHLEANAYDVHRVNAASLC